MPLRSKELTGPTSFFSDAASLPGRDFAASTLAVNRQQPWFPLEYRYFRSWPQSTLFSGFTLRKWHLQSVQPDIGWARGLAVLGEGCRRRP